MDLKEIKDFIKQVENELLEIPENDLESYLFDEFDVPIFFRTHNFDIKHITNLHFKANSYLTIIRDLAPTRDDEVFEILISLLKIKLILDNTIKSHPKYTKVRFNKEYNKKQNKLKNNVFIPLHKDISKRKLKFITMTFELLVEEMRINKSQKQTFAYLFLPFINKEKIIWNAPIYDLKRFFDLMIEKQLIVPQEYFNEFISENFRIQNKQGKCQSFKVTSFKTANTKTGYQNEYYKWEDKIENLKHSLIS